MHGILLALLALVLASNLLSLVETDKIAEFVWQAYIHIAPGVAVRDLRAKRVELQRVRAERAATSSQDEFAKWARLDREHQKVKKELDTVAASVAVSRRSVTSATAVAKWLAISGSQLFIQWHWRSKAVAWLPEHHPSIFPGYIRLLLSAPSAPRGSVSASAWLFLCNSAVSTSMRLVHKFRKIRA